MTIADDDYDPHFQLPSPSSLGSRFPHNDSWATNTWICEENDEKVRNRHTEPTTLELGNVYSMHLWHDDSGYQEKDPGPVFERRIETNNALELDEQYDSDGYADIIV